MEGGAGAVEVGEFHPRIFTGEDDAVGIALEGGEDGIANAVGRALAVGELGGDDDGDLRGQADLTSEENLLPPEARDGWRASLL